MITRVLGVGNHSEIQSRRETGVPQGWSGAEDTPWGRNPEVGLQADPEGPHCVIGKVGGEGECHWGVEASELWPHFTPTPHLGTGLVLMSAG